MSEETEVLRKQAIATVAAALITTRGAKTIEAARIAIEDAKHLLNPQPLKPDYRKWQEDRGDSPLSDEEVKQVQATRGKNLVAAAKKVAGGV